MKIKDSSSNFGDDMSILKNKNIKYRNFGTAFAK